MNRRVRTAIGKIGEALRAFLKGFVGRMDLPRQPAAARDELVHRCSGRDRCC